MSIVYNKQFLQTLKELSRISPYVVMKKVDGNIVITQKNEHENINYIITTPEKNFQFDKNEIAFFNYVEFYSFLELFSNPEISIENNKVVLSENNSKTEYFLSNVEACKVGFPCPWNNPDIKFDLPQKELETLIKASSLFPSSETIKKARIVGNEKSVSIELVNVNINPKQKTYDKTFSKQLDVTSITGKPCEYDFVVNREIFINSPKRSYSIELKKEGFMKAGYQDSDYFVDIFCLRLQ